MANQTKKKRWLYALVALGVLAVLGAAYLVFFGIQTIAFFKGRQIARDNPGLYLQPQPLALEPITWPEGSAHSYFGYEFTLPPGIVDETAGDTVIRMFLNDQRVFVFANPAKATKPRDVWIETVRERGAEKQMAAIYGEKMLESNYGWYDEVFRTTPDELAIFTSRQEAARASILLMMKMPEVARIQALYSFDVGSLKGFQLGSPDADRMVRVFAFDEHDEILEFMFGARENQGRWSQEEINGVLLSVRPVREAR